MDNIKVLRLQDLDSIIQYEQKCLEQQIDDPIKRSMVSWNASWRQEALEYYLPKGWSFAVWGGEYQDLQGYLLAQPMLFVNSFTQSLWVETVSFLTSETAIQLIDVAYRTCREKHFQKVLFKDAEILRFALKSYKGLSDIHGWAEIPTAKM